MRGKIAQKVGIPTSKVIRHFGVLIATVCLLLLLCSSYKSLSDVNDICCSCNDDDTNGVLLLLLLLLLFFIIVVEVVSVIVLGVEVNDDTRWYGCWCCRNSRSIVRIMIVLCDCFIL